MLKRTMILVLHTNTFADETRATVFFYGLVMLYNQHMNNDTGRTYIAIDLKSFYASVECQERGLNPLTSNLVVADEERTDKTICLAVSPSLKSYGISGRARLFEVRQKVNQVNRERQRRISWKDFTGSSCEKDELERDAYLKLEFLAAPPRMSLYMEYSRRIYEIYLRYLAPEDIHVYSIDEIMADVTDYLETYRMTARELCMTMILDILRETGITATAGIGTNLFLCKVAMDIVAKHIDADENGVRIAELDEETYRKTLWTHRPIRDFWRVGKGIAAKLEAEGIYTMGDIARCSLGGITDYYNEDLLYRLFGINAELLIDHAWGKEPCTMKQIKAFRPSSESLGIGQVLTSPYTFEKAEIIVREMAEALSENLLSKHLMTDTVVLYVGYDISNLDESNDYKGDLTTDFYGRTLPKSMHGSIHLGVYTSSSRLISDKLCELYHDQVNEKLTIRRINVSAVNLRSEEKALRKQIVRQGSLFSDNEREDAQMKESLAAIERERNVQKALLDIRNKFGKNSVMKARDLQDGATQLQRNKQIGGHKA